MIANTTVASARKRIALASATSELVSDPLAAGKTLQARPPVRFNASMLCSFTRAGEVTNGSVVLSDGTYATIVRVHGTTGRIEVWRWNGKGWKSGV